MRPNRPRKNPALPASPLSAQRTALQERERQVQEQMARYEKLLEDAPKLAAQRQKERREEHINRSSRLEKRAGGVAQLPDRRFEANIAAPAQHRRLRAERRQGRLMFFVLLLTLAASIFYLYYTVTRG